MIINTRMSESNLTKNEIVVEGDKVKKPLFKVVLFLIFLIILGFAFYFFKGTFFSLLNKKAAIKNTSTEVSESEKDSPFGNLVSNSSVVPSIDVVSKDKEPQYYIKLYDEYKMGEMGLRYEFRGLDEENMSLKLIDKTEEGNVEKTFPLSKDFLIVCTEFDFSKYGLDFSQMQDSEKYSTAFNSNSMPYSKKIGLLKNYQNGSSVGLVFTGNPYSNPANFAVKKILIFSPNVDECYSYEE